jgi:cell fate (sporulation/competence/biofilm development) regulator YlbF (YheA/YmcA/DUF963 family)
MNQVDLRDFEVASPSVVRAAARDFATALSETPQFKAFESAYKALKEDSSALQALSAYQEKARALQALLMLNAVGEIDRAELERLRNEYMTHATVQACAVAESELTALCHQAAGMISDAIGLNYAAAFGASCCG